MNSNYITECVRVPSRIDLLPLPGKLVIAIIVIMIFVALFGTVCLVVDYGLDSAAFKEKISGDHFMLTGDAANLIDPVTGEGIGHAAISGMYAAEQCKRSLGRDDFSADFMQQYDRSVYERIGKELSISSKIPRFIKYPWLFNIMVNRALNSKTLQERLTLAMTDLEVRKRLKDPRMYLKVLLGR